MKEMDKMIMEVARNAVKEYLKHHEHGAGCLYWRERWIEKWILWERNENAVIWNMKFNIWMYQWTEKINS